MHHCPALERLLALDLITEARIEAEIGCKELVRIEADHATAEAARFIFRMGDKGAAEPSTLRVRIDADILDQEIIVARDHLDKADHPAVDQSEVDHMMAHGVIIICRHRQGLAAEDIAPFGVGLARQRAHTNCIFRTRATKLDGSGHDQSRLGLVSPSSPSPVNSPSNSSKSLASRKFL